MSCHPCDRNGPWLCWCALLDSNQGPPPCEGDALPLSQARTRECCSRNARPPGGDRRETPIVAEPAGQAQRDWRLRQSRGSGPSLLGGRARDDAGGRRGAPRPRRRCEAARNRRARRRRPGRRGRRARSTTIDASAKKVSRPVVTMAAGAVPARIASSSTAVVVDEPRENGTTRTRPRGDLTAERMALIDDRAGRRVVAAPEGERLRRDQGDCRAPRPARAPRLRW